MATNPTQGPTLAPTTPNLPTSNPVQLMDWETKLKRGDTTAQTRAVGANETVKQQLNDLTASNSKYIRNATTSANAQSADKGMLMSSVAAGAARRASIDAALPIAQQDASTYASTAKDNMDATNADRLADQQMFGNLTGQEVGIRANLDEAERGRGFTAQQQDKQNTFSADQQAKQNQFATSERLGSETFQGRESALTRDLDRAKQQSDQLWQSMERGLDRGQNATQFDKQQMQERFKIFDAAMQSNQNALANTLSSIYGNTNLNSSQQASAAANARATYESLMKSYAATMAGGVPEIYWDPYPAGGAIPTPTGSMSSTPTSSGTGTNTGVTGGTTIPGRVPTAPWKSLDQIDGGLR